MAPPTAIDTNGYEDTTSKIVADPLTIAGVSARRAKAPKISGGIATYAGSEMFKGPVVHGKPKAKRWDYRLNDESTSRKGSSIKSAIKYLKTPGLISLGGGLPSSQYFPIESIDIKVPLPGHFSEEETKESGIVLHTGKYDYEEGKGLYDLHIALNYGHAAGAAQLLRFVTEHTEIVHNPPYQDWACVLTSASTSSLDMAFRLLTTRGEYILSEEYTFATAVETALPMGVRTIGIKMDEQGLLASSMDDILSNWDENARGGKKPWLLYTVPSGHNPTGATQGHERRKAIYAMAQKHDVYILEDEPYFFLQMQPYTGPNAPDVPPPASHGEFIRALIPSLLSMDVDGRVMRMDSFSKVIAPGARVGWITASEQMIERLNRHIEVSTQHPSGISQIVLYKLLEEGWGHAGYLDWLIHLRLQYTKRRDNICYACETFLPKEIASWNPPAAGMFHWIQINYTLHPHYRSGTKTFLEIEEDILQASVAKGVLLIKGSFFRAERPAKTDIDSGEDTGEGHGMFFRATFAAAPGHLVAEAIRRFGEALRAEFGLDGAS